ncbi:MAG: helix-turn-helix domain-containing protein [Alphaproteobacteria bacterium]|nr:helix-turn-helix domain-containing protein [Alphaproteobacteria bacterium]
MTRRPLHVSVIVFPECDPSIIYGVYDTLWAAGRLSSAISGGARGTPLFEPRVVAADAGPLLLVTGVSVVPQDRIADVARTDIVFVPNVLVEASADLRALDRRLLDWIRDRYRGGAQLYAACGGSLVLAEAGLLDGHEATTHWGYAPLFRRLYPKVVLHEDRILVQSGPGHDIVCSGGASSWQDLALLLIARHGGTEEAIRISKLFLYQWHREGQLPFASMIQNVDHGDAAILRCQTWLADNYHRADIVAALVGYSGLPKRTFDRRFRQATGYAPLAYVQALRIEEAKQMLETGPAPVEEVAREVGYADTASFRRLFRRLAGMTPGDYRRKFQLPKFVGRAVAQGREARPPAPAAPGKGATSSQPVRAREP